MWFRRNVLPTLRLNSNKAIRVDTWLRGQEKNSSSCWVIYCWLGQQMKGVRGGSLVLSVAVW